MAKLPSREPDRRHNPDNPPPTPKLITPSDDTSRDVMPKDWRRGLVPLKRK